MTEQDATDSDEAGAEERTGGHPAAENGVEADGEAAPDVDAEAATNDAETAGDAGADPDEDLVDRVANADPADVASEIAALRTQIEGLEEEVEAKEAEIDDLTSKLKRKQADFENYKKRMEKRSEQERERALADLIEPLLDVRDNLVRALEQDEGTDIRGGVESTLRQFDDVLRNEDVEVIDPEPGSAVDPHVHEVLVKVESEQPDGTVAEVHRPGYEMGDTVLREAQVTVSEGAAGDDADA